jgi:hypothetical protein
MIQGQTQTGTEPVVPDYVWFTKNYPETREFVSPERYEQLFDIATMMLDNTGSSFVRDTGRRQRLLHLLICHLAQVSGLLQPSAGPGAVTGGMGVGRVSSASEGAVSVSFDYPAVPGAEWFNMSQYGALFWSATAIFRRGGRYYPGPQRYREVGTQYPWRYRYGRDLI